MSETSLHSPLKTPAPIPDSDAPLYVKRKQIYPQSIKGTFRTAKWIILCISLGVYYLLPFVRWDRGPNAPHQAVLVDLPGRRLYFFFIEIWPQEVYYLTGLLVLAALTLFLMNAVAGRLWCGYLCPQTVWTDLFYAVERWVEGDRREHLRHENDAFNLKRASRTVAKHAIWLAIAWWTGGAWVLYFSDAPTLVRELATFQAPLVAWIWIGILTFTTYALAGHMREQVCVYMCPWPRIQAALTDEYALNVTYRYDRGEPRGSLKKVEAQRAKGLPGGDCVDCDQCVVVCPTGVDIREGLQIDCIQCGLCIDACDAVMAKLNRPHGLIAYDTDMNIKRRLEGKPSVRRIIRPRTILYAALIVVVGAMMMTKLATRETFGFSVIHDRNPLFVLLTDGSIRNAYTLRIANKKLDPHRYLLQAEGVTGGNLSIVDINPDADGRDTIVIEPDQTREIRVLITTHAALPQQSTTPETFTLTDLDDNDTIKVTDHFIGR